MPSFDVVDLKKFPTSLNTFVVGKMYSRYRRGCCFLSTFFSPSVSRNVCINRQRPSLFGGCFCCCCCCWRPCPLVLFLSDFCLWAIQTMLAHFSRTHSARARRLFVKTMRIYALSFFLSPILLDFILGLSPFPRLKVGPAFVLFPFWFQFQVCPLEQKRKKEPKNLSIPTKKVKRFTAP